MVGTLLAPRLLATDPLLLMLLSPRTMFLGVAAATSSFPVFVALATLRLAAADPSHYFLGRHLGPRLATWLGARGGGSPTVSGPGRLVSTVGLPIAFLVPTGKVLLVAGAIRLPHRQVAAAAVAGTVARVVALYAAGRMLEDPIGAISGQLAVHAWAVSGVVAAALVGVAIWRRGGSPLVKLPATCPFVETG